MDAFYAFIADDGWALASHIALSALLALFPFLIVLTALAGFLGSKDIGRRSRQPAAGDLAEGGRDPAGAPKSTMC